MRLIGTLDTLEHAKLFCANLCAKKIDHSLEGCGIWVHNEDQIDEAIALLKEFEENPSDPKFDVPLVEPESEVSVFDQETGEPIDEEAPEVAELLIPRRTGHFTTFLVALCTMLFFLSGIQEVPLLEKGIPANAYITTPVESLLFFDMPPEVEKLDELVFAYEVPPGQKEVPPLPSNITEQIKVVSKTPFWRGLSTIALLKMEGQDTTLAHGPMFGKILQGEFWRLLTPIFLHGSFLHILFNMMWLWLLGRQVEQRVGVFRYLILTVLIAVFSNVLQYCMSGPFFLGYSGVILGLAGFIWSRESLAPWEGYPLQKTMISFLALFVLAMIFLQAVSVVLLLLSFSSFDPNIANTAHIAGAIAGVLLGRLSFFAARPVV